MTATVGDIAVRVGVDITSLISGMKSAGKHVDDFGGKLGINAKNAAAWGVAAAAAASAVAVGLAALTKQGLDFVDSQRDAAISMDGTINGLRAIQLAGEEAGISSETMVASMQMLSRKLAEAAAEGGPAADALKAVGLSAADLSAMDADDRLAAIADKAQALGLTTGETSRLLQTMGIKSRDMALLVSGGGDAIREAQGAVRSFGLSVSQDMADSVDEANDAVGRMGLIMEGLRNQLAAQVAPALTVMAQNFTAMATAGGPLQEGVGLIAEAVGNLAARVADPAFANAVVMIGVNLLTAATKLADGMVWLTENINAAAMAVGALGVALAVLGGPVTLAIRLMAGAAAAYLLMGDNSSKAEDGAYNVAAAEAALNGELNVFSQSASPAARNESRARVISLKEQATAALSAAQAELALSSAMAESAAAKSDLNAADMLNESAGPGGGMADHFAGLPDERAAAASKRIADLTAQIREMTAALKDMDASGGSGGSVVVPPLPEVPNLPGLPDLGAGNGGKSKGGAADKMADELEKLQEKLMTEAELELHHYEEQQKMLQDALEKKLITQEEYNTLMADAQRAHQEEMSSIDQLRYGTGLQMAGAFFGQMASAMQGGGDKMVKAARVFGAAEALINSWVAFSQVLRDPTLPFYAKLPAAMSVLAAGMGAVSAIKSGSSGSSSGGKSSSRSSSEASSSSSSSPAQVTLNLQGPGADMFRGFISPLADALRDEFGDRGYVLGVNAA